MRFVILLLCCSLLNGETPAEVKARALDYMGQLDGWCSDKKATFLIDLVLRHKPDKIVEIGVYGGKSVVPMAVALQANGHGTIYGIDPWSNAESLEWVADPSNIAYWGWIDLNAILAHLQSKIVYFNLSPYIELIRNTSEKTPPIEEIDILHVDGNHSDVTSYFDVVKWVPLVKKGGWIIFDDMTWFENGTYTTARAVEWLNEHCTKVAEIPDNSIWGVWVKL